MVRENVPPNGSIIFAHLQSEALDGSVHKINRQALPHTWVENIACGEDLRGREEERRSASIFLLDCFVQYQLLKVSDGSLNVRCLDEAFAMVEGFVHGGWEGGRKKR